MDFSKLLDPIQALLLNRRTSLVNRLTEAVDSLDQHTVAMRHVETYERPPANTPELTAQLFNVLPSVDFLRDYPNRWVPADALKSVRSTEASARTATQLLVQQLDKPALLPPQPTDFSAAVKSWRNAVLAFRDALAVLTREIESGARTIMIRFLALTALLSCAFGFPAPRALIGETIYDVFQRPHILKELSARIAPAYNKDRSFGAPYVSRSLLVRDYFHGGGRSFDVRDEDELLAFLAQSKAGNQGQYQNIAITGQYGSSQMYMIAELLTRQAARGSSRPPYPVVVAGEDVKKSVDELVLRTIPRLWYVAPEVLEAAERKSVVLVVRILSAYRGLNSTTEALLNLTTNDSRVTLLLGCDVDVFDRYIRGYRRAPNAILEVQIQPFRDEQLPLMLAARMWTSDSNSAAVERDGVVLATALGRHPRTRAFALTSWAALFAVYDSAVRQARSSGEPSAAELATALAQAPVDSLLQPAMDSMHAEYSKVIVDSLQNERASEVKITEGVDAASIVATLLSKSFAAVAGGQSSFNDQSFKQLLQEATATEPVFSRGSTAGTEILLGRVKNSPAFKYSRDTNWRTFDQ